MSLTASVGPAKIITQMAQRIYNQNMHAKGGLTVLETAKQNLTPGASGTTKHISLQKGGRLLGKAVPSPVHRDFFTFSKEALLLSQGVSPKVVSSAATIGVNQRYRPILKGPII